MASTGFIIAAAGANVNATGQAWTNPGNITADDSTTADSANVPTTTNTDYLKATFSLSGLIASGSTIDGIEVRIHHWRTGNGMAPVTVQLSLDGSSPTGDNKGNNTIFPTNPGGVGALVVYGGSSDLWGVSPSRDQVVNANFSVFHQHGHISGGGAHTSLVDEIEINVHYTEGAGVSRKWILTRPA